MHNYHPLSLITACAVVSLFACKARDFGDTTSVTNEDKTLGAVLFATATPDDVYFDLCAYEYPSNLVSRSPADLQTLMFDPVNRKKWNLYKSKNNSMAGVGTVVGGAATTVLSLAACVAASLAAPPTVLLTAGACAALIGGGWSAAAGGTVAVYRASTAQEAWKAVTDPKPHAPSLSDYNNVKKTLASSGNTDRQCDEISGANLKKYIEEGRKIAEKNTQQDR